MHCSLAEQAKHAPHRGPREEAFYICSGGSLRASRCRGTSYVGPKWYTGSGSISLITGPPLLNWQ
jgi:hypothetical protein